MIDIVPVSEIPKEVTDAPLSVMTLYRLVVDMAIVAAKHNGVGLSAVQVGIPYNVFVVTTNPDAKNQMTEGWKAYVNCDYEPVDDEQIAAFEGCLSLPGERYMVSRYRRVRFHGKELIVDSEKPILRDLDIVVDGFQSIVVQHEIDHAKGILISDKGRKFTFW